MKDACPHEQRLLEAIRQHRASHPPRAWSEPDRALYSLLPELPDPPRVVHVERPASALDGLIEQAEAFRRFRDDDDAGPTTCPECSGTGRIPGLWNHTFQCGACAGLGFRPRAAA